MQSNRLLLSDAGIQTMVERLPDGTVVVNEGVIAPGGFVYNPNATRVYTPAEYPQIAKLHDGERWDMGHIVQFFMGDV